MKIFIGLLGLAAWFITFCVGAQDTKTTVSSITSIEERYFHTRDQYIVQFAKMTVSNQQNAEIGANLRKALIDLEKQLKAIIGPIHVIGFPKQGRINLETLMEELGFGMVDGLKYTNQSEAALTGTKSDTLFITTKALLNNYLQNNPQYPKDLNQLAESGKFGSSINFYSEVFDADVSVTTYFELPIKKAKGQAFARAFLGIFSQDIGPSYIPTQIFVIAARDDKIFVVSAQSKTKIDQIAQCKQQSDDLWRKADDALIAYRKSGLKNSSLFEKSTKHEEQSFLEYQHCFGREANRQSFFAPLTFEAQSIVDSL